MLGAPKRALGWHCKGLVSILYTFCKQIFIVESDTDPPPPPPPLPSPTPLSPQALTFQVSLQLVVILSPSPVLLS